MSYTQRLLLIAPAAMTRTAAFDRANALAKGKRPGKSSTRSLR